MVSTVERFYCIILRNYAPNTHITINPFLALISTILDSPVTDGKFEVASHMSSQIVLFKQFW